MGSRRSGGRGKGRGMKKAGAGLLALFGVFTFISAATLGGGLSMVPVMSAEFRKRSWMEEGPFYAVFAKAQAFPGPIAVTMAWSLGRELRGTAGAVLSVLGVVIPPFFSVILVAWIVSILGSPPWLKSFFSGVYATVPGLAAALAYRMIRKKRWRLPALLACVPLSAALIVFRGWAVPVFFGGVAAWFFLGRAWKS
jgi:chromate transporter